ncbi:MAG TPA: hemolysin family protein [Thermoanaerobaculia bacterium]|nr:hemolysin family protein [Thermoanaerobaculia bacterium]
MGIVPTPIALAGSALGQLELSPGFGLVLAALLVFANGFFVAAEFALVKVRPTQVDSYLKTRRGRVARHMVEHLDAYLSATQLGITLSSLGLGWIGEPAVARLLQRMVAWIPGLELSDVVLHSISLALGFTLISVAHIVLGELAPKSLAIRKPEATSLWVALPLYAFYWISFPAIWALNHMANALLLLVGIQPVTGAGRSHEEEELRRILASSAESRLSEHKRELLDNVFELSHRVARQVMVPRAEVVYLDLEAPIEDSLQLARESGHTRFPLCEGDLDRVVGMVHIKDLFRSEERPVSLRDVRRDIFFVPGTLPLDRLLRRMRNEHVHLTAVLDEYGSVAGIVTFENVIEEIVGEVQDEFDEERPELTPLGEDTYQVLGSMLVEDLEDALELNLFPDERDEDTMAGVVLSELGRRAKVGDRLQVGRLELEVLEVALNRILSIKLTVKPLPDELAGLAEGA